MCNIDAPAEVNSQELFTELTWHTYNSVPTTAFSTSIPSPNKTNSPWGVSLPHSFHLWLSQYACSSSGQVPGNQSIPASLLENLSFVICQLDIPSGITGEESQWSIFYIRSACSDCIMLSKVGGLLPWIWGPELKRKWTWAPMDKISCFSFLMPWLPSSLQSGTERKLTRSLPSCFCQDIFTATENKEIEARKTLTEDAKCCKEFQCKSMSLNLS